MRLLQTRQIGLSRFLAPKLVLASSIAFSLFDTQAVAQTVPNAGTILKETQTLNPLLQPSTSRGPLIERENAPVLPASAPFLVSTIAISGHTLFDTSTLHALVAEVEGKTLTLSQLGESVARITEFYQRHGYPLSRAIVPAQTIHNGTVQIQVIEARYAKIKVDNHSRVAGLLFERTLSSLRNGQPIQQAPLERAVLLASDIPGAVVNSTLRPGDAVGTSDLEVDVKATPETSGNVTLDNDGNRFTGRVRLGGTFNFINPLQHGDVLSGSVLTTGPDMNYLSVTYETLLNGDGTRAGGSFSGLRYVLGDTLASVDAHGSAQVASLWIKQPLVRSVDFNLYGQTQFDHKQLDDEIDATSIQTDRHLDRWAISLAGDSHDTILAGGVNTWNIGGMVAGRLAFDNPGARLTDSLTAKTQGSFSILNLTASRLQYLNSQNALYFRFSGQLASRDLDPSEKMLAGGPYTVRAYDVGAATGDGGIFGSAEYRREFGHVWNGSARALFFLDSEHVTVNKITWTSGPNDATLSGAGLGFDWSGLNQWSAKASIAVPFGPTPALVSNSKSVRAWMEIDKGF